MHRWVNRKPLPGILATQEHRSKQQGDGRGGVGGGGSMTSLIPPLLEHPVIPQTELDKLPAVRP